MYNFGTSFQLRDELFFYIRLVFLSTEKGVLNAPRHWKKLRKENLEGEEVFGPQLEIAFIIAS